MRLAPVLLLLGTAVAGCTGIETSGANDRSTVAADPVGAVEPTAVAEALHFSALVVGGDDLDLTVLGDRPVVFWFWSPFCSICNAEAASVQAALRAVHRASRHLVPDDRRCLRHRLRTVPDHRPAGRGRGHPDGEVRTLPDAAGPAISAVLAGVT